MATLSKLSKLELLMIQLDRSKLVQNLSAKKIEERLFDAYCDAHASIGVSICEYACGAYDFLVTAFMGIHYKLAEIQKETDCEGFEFKPEFFREVAVRYRRNHYGSKTETKQNRKDNRERRTH